MFDNFFFEDRAVYEKMCKNIVDMDRRKMTVRHMCIVYWKTMSTHTLGILFLHCKNGCTKAPHSYICMLTLPVLSFVSLGLITSL
jgi:hypothetical protein